MYHHRLTISAWSRFKLLFGNHVALFNMAWGAILEIPMRQNVLFHGSKNNTFAKEKHWYFPYNYSKHRFLVPFLTASLRIIL